MWETLLYSDEVKCVENASPGSSTVSNFIKKLILSNIIKYR